MLAYADHLRTYGDLAANPGASFRDLAHTMTTGDGAKRTHRPTRHTSTGTSTGPTTSTPGSTTTTTPTPLPTRLGVDEREYSLFLSHNPVGTGSVEFNLSNFGGDDHDLHIDTSGPSPQPVASTGVVSPGTSTTINVALTPGTYTLYCSLADHRALGMQTTLTVK